MKQKVKLLAYLVAFSTMFTACDKNTNSDQTVAVLDSSNLEECSKDIDGFDISNLNIEEVEEMQDEDKELDDITKLYLDYFNSLDFVYEYYDRYISDNTINRLNSINLNTCSFSFTNYEDICDQIIKNSNYYVASHPEYENVFTNDINIDSLYRIIDKVLNHGTNDIFEDAHKFSDMVIVYGENLDCAIGMYYDDINVIVLNREMISTIASCEEILIRNVFEYILGHEVNHARQNLCDCNINDVIHDIRYSPYESFILESSSESSLYNQNIKDIGLYTYTDERRCEGELLLLALFNNNNNDINNYYNAIFDSDFKALYEYLGISENEYRNFYDILYNMDALLFRNDLPFDILEDEYTIEGFIDTIEKIGFTYKLDLFKLCLKNLMTYSSLNDLEYSEHIVLYNIIKNTLLSKYESVNYSSYFIDTIISMDNEYVNYLSSYYNVSVEEIRDFEYIDARIIGVAINEVICNMELTNPSMEDIARSYIDKYPLLSNILCNTLIYNSNSYIHLNRDAYSKYAR